MVTQFTDSHVVKNKSKNKTNLIKFGTVKNNKQQLLFPISISHRPSHGYIPGLCTLTPKTYDRHEPTTNVFTVTPQVAITTTHGAAKSCQTDDS